MIKKILAVTIVILFAGTVGFNLHKLPYFEPPVFTGKGGVEVEEPIDKPIEEPVIDKKPLTIKEIRTELGKMVLVCDELYDDLKISVLFE